MTQEDFLRQLRELLSDISAEEREEAVKYYEDYFADAGKEKEADVIAELGSPEALAKAIRTEVAGTKAIHDAEGEYTEQGFHDADYYENLEYLEQKRCQQKYQGYNSERNTNGTEEEKYSSYSKTERWPRERGNKRWVFVLACIFFFPVILPLVCGVFGVCLGFLGAVVGLYAGGIGCIAGGAVLVVTGVAHAFSFLPTAAVVFGAGLTVAGIGMLLLAGASASLKGTIYLFRGTIKLVGSLFHGGRQKRSQEYYTTED